MLLNLNLIQHQSQLKISKEENKTLVYDPIRKKKVILTPEEMTRQLIIHYLNLEKDFSTSFIQVEKKIKVNGMDRRYDLIVYDKTIKPFLLLECKSHKITLTQNSFNQISSYNLSLKAPFLLISNGFDSYCYKVDHENNQITALKEVPSSKGSYF